MGKNGIAYQKFWNARATHATHTGKNMKKTNERMEIDAPVTADRTWKHCCRYEQSST